MLRVLVSAMVVGTAITPPQPSAGKRELRQAYQNTLGGESPRVRHVQCTAFVHDPNQFFCSFERLVMQQDGGAHQQAPFRPQIKQWQKKSAIIALDGAVWTLIDEAVQQRNTGEPALQKRQEPPVPNNQRN